MTKKLADLFSITPADLLDSGIFYQMASALHAGTEHRRLSLAVVAQRLGAVSRKSLRGGVITAATNAERGATASLSKSRLLSAPGRLFRSSERAGRGGVGVRGGREDRGAIEPHDARSREREGQQGHEKEANDSDHGVDLGGAALPECRHIVNQLCRLHRFHRTAEKARVRETSA